MRNFYEIPTSHFLSGTDYLSALEKTLNLESEKNKCQSLASHAKNLWQSFSQRDPSLSHDFDKHYMDKNALLLAYAASFLLPNIERVFSILSNDEVEPNLVKILSSKNHLNVLDFGSGPLSATAGFLFALEHFFQRNSALIPLQKINLFSVDRSQKAASLGFDLLQKALSPNVEINHIWAPSSDKIQDKIDVVLCANIFNEIPVKHRLLTLQNIYQKMEEEGLLLVLEPGQEVHSKALGALRDLFLDSPAGASASLVGPCLHTKKCPMLGRPKDWCWFRHSWKPPKILDTMDKYTKIDHAVLNFSYLFFKKMKPTGELHDLFARAVSDTLPVDLTKAAVATYVQKNIVPSSQSGDFPKIWQNEVLEKTMLCTRDGQIESLLYEPGEHKNLSRGATIKKEESSLVRMKETTTWKT